MNTKQYGYIFLLFCAAMMSTGCASIFNSPIQSVRIDSNPQNATYTIADENGEQIAQGVTPDTVVLHASGAPFQAARYSVNYKHKDYPGKTKSLVGKLSGWYIANIVSFYPSLIGALIIDPYTGTMYNLPSESRVDLSSQPSSARTKDSAIALKKPTLSLVPAQ